jgi:hypothetical protein
MDLFSVKSDSRLYNEKPIINESLTHVEAGSNTSTVTLRVVGGDEKGSLKSKTVKYGRESQGTRTQERLRWRRPAPCTKDRPVLSKERTPHKKQDSNCQKVINIWSWAPDGARHQDWLTDRLTDRQSECYFDFDLKWEFVWRQNSSSGVSSQKKMKCAKYIVSCQELNLKRDLQIGIEGTSSRRN